VYEKFTGVLAYSAFLDCDIWSWNLNVLVNTYSEQTK